MSRDPDVNDHAVSHNSFLWVIMDQGAVGWMCLKRSAQTRRKLKNSFSA